MEKKKLQLEKERSFELINSIVKKINPKNEGNLKDTDAFAGNYETKTNFFTRSKNAESQIIENEDKKVNQQEIRSDYIDQIPVQT